MIKKRFNKYMKYENEELYHYTSIESVKKIIESKTIILTDYRFLNDPNELVLGIDSCINFCKEIKVTESDTNKINKINFLLKAFENLQNNVIQSIKLNNHTQQQIKPCLEAAVFNDMILYILSMTHKRDKLEMWASYGKDGCCIKFNSNHLFEFFDTIRNAYFSKGLTNQIRNHVRYSHTHQFSYLKLLIDDRSINSIALNLLTDCYSLCALYKNDCFSYEEEYRCCLPISDSWLNESNKDFNKIFGYSKGNLKPQMKFNNFPVKDIIEEIIISPYNKSELIESGLKEFLKFQGLNPNIVKKSSIKIR